MKNREKTRDKASKNSRKTKGKRCCAAAGEKEMQILKPVGYPSGHVTYPSGRSLPCHHLAELRASRRVT
jgi:hypothetical protein